MSTISYKCPNCGGPLVFDPERQRFFCDYCDSDFEETVLVSMAREKEAAQAESAQRDAEKEAGGESLLFTCPSCGAEIIMGATTAATFCYYCHNPVVVSGRLVDEFRPDKVLPFVIDKEEAIQRFFEWIRKKKYVPKGFFSKDQIEKISGVYYPYWVADYQVDAHFQGEGQIVSSHRRGNYQITTTQHYHVVRDADLQFDDIVRPALSTTDRKLADGVHPFDLENARDFSSAYLSGFMAEKRDVDSESLRQDVENEIEGYTESLVRSTASYSSLTGNTSSSYRNVKYEYMLLPTWVLTYKGADGKMYYFSMNGQTGTVCGRLPISKGKLFRNSGILAGILAAVICVGGWLFI